LILVLGGTADGRIAAEQLADKKQDTLYSSVSGYYQPRSAGPLTLHTGAMDLPALTAFMKQKAITLCVDATHPYAKTASENAMAASKAAGIRYIRLERPGMAAAHQTGEVLGFPDYDAAVQYLKNHPGNILTTTGSRELEHYSVLDKKRLYLRVLPTSGVLKKCEALGYKPNRIIAVQGPFSVALNRAMMAAWAIRYVTTKDSGDLGGVKEKIEAAQQCGARVICIERPKLDYPEVCETPGALIERLKINEETQDE
jgi:precorrin-6A/cobalt-precorrin-6A reductase